MAMDQNAMSRPGRRGVTLLELALVAPLVLFTLFGAIEFAYILYVKQTMQAASRDGARRAAIATSTDAAVRQAVDEAMHAGGLGNAHYSVQIKHAAAGSVASVASIPAGEGVCVEIKAPWTQFSVFLSGFGDWSRSDLTSRTTIRRER